MREKLRLLNKPSDSTALPIKTPVRCEASLPMTHGSKAKSGKITVKVKALCKVNGAGKETPVWSEAPLPTVHGKIFPNVQNAQHQNL